MAELMRMPEVLANSTEAILQSWLIEIGTEFTVGDPIATVETDKAVVDIEADRDGCLLKILVPDGASVGVGTSIAVVGAAGEEVRDFVGPLPPVEPSERTAARVFASPLARRLAKEHGLAIEDIDGSGPRGRVRRGDVEAALTRSAPARLPGAGAAASVRSAADEPHSRFRRAVARRLTESKRDVPHFYLRASCRVDRLLDLRTEVNQHAAVKVSVNDLVLKAAARAHRAVPELNVAWTDEAVRRFDAVDIAVAVATERGLLTPVVRDADSCSVTALAQAVRTLRTRAEAGELRQEELEGGSLTITNLGMFGTEEFAAIINPPQVAILAVGAAREEAVVVRGELTVGTVMRVTLSVDHRPVDGVVAARWLAAFVNAVEDPVQLLV